MSAANTVPLRIIAGIRAVVTFAVIAIFWYMLAAVLVQIVGRYLLNYSISGTEETARFAQVWMVLLGAGIAMRRGQHVAVDFLVARLPLRVARLLSIAVAAGGLWFLGIVALGSQPLIEIGLIRTSSALLLPMWIIYLCLPIGACYFGLEIVLSVVRRWNQPFGVERAEADVEGSS